MIFVSPIYPIISKILKRPLNHFVNNTSTPSVTNLGLSLNQRGLQLTNLSG